MVKANSRHRWLWVLVLLWSCWQPTFARAQFLQKDLAFLLKKRQAPKVFNIKNELPATGISHRQASEIKLMLSGAIRVYQMAASSQDASTCNFVPSCSRFSKTALERAGLIRGLLLTSDRLQRCNGLPGIARHYPYLPRVGKFADPIERYTGSSLSSTNDE